MSVTPRSPGRPLDGSINAELLHATQDLLIEEGVERLTVEAVAKRCGASKATIYRRWPSKTALVVAATAALFRLPETPDTGSLREDLLACGRAYLHENGRHQLVLASVLTAARHDQALREAARDAVGAPFSGLFHQVLTRAVHRGLIPDTTDIDTIAEILPAVAYQRTTTAATLNEDDVVRVVDHVLLPALLAPATPVGAPTR